MVEYLTLTLIGTPGLFNVSSPSGLLTNSKVSTGLLKSSYILLSIPMLELAKAQPSLLSFLLFTSLLSLKYSKKG